jgi:hypothetical protein
MIVITNKYRGQPSKIKGSDRARKAIEVCPHLFHREKGHGNCDGWLKSWRLSMSCGRIIGGGVGRRT